MSQLERRVASLEAVCSPTGADPVKIIWLTGPDGIPQSVDCCLVVGRDDAEIEANRCIARQQFERMIN